MEEVFELTSIKIDPETSLIHEGLKIQLLTPKAIRVDEVEYVLKSEMKDWEWAVRYTVDVAYKRAVLELGKQKMPDCKPGKYTKEFAIPSINLSSVSKKDLMNVGLLSLCGVQSGKDVTALV